MKFVKKIIKGINFNNIDGIREYKAYCQLFMKKWKTFGQCCVLKFADSPVFDASYSKLKMAKDLFTSCVVHTCTLASLAKMPMKLVTNFDNRYKKL